MSHRRAACGLVAALLAVVACGPSPSASSAPLRVFAAASLTAAFESLGRAFEAQHPGTAVELHCAGTPQLVMQLREGAPAAVFASADAENMQRVVGFAAGCGEPVVFATNHLTIVTPSGNPRAIAGLADLARSDVRVVLCGPTVPAGRYARQALTAAGIGARSVSDEPSVRAVVAKVMLGEVDAGIVFATDALAAGSRVVTVPIDAALDVEARYPIVALGPAPERERGAAFVRFVTSPAGQAILAQHGFGPP